MASNKLVRFGPVGLGVAVANIINPPTLSGGTGIAGTNTATYVVLRHLRIVNKTGNAATFSLYIGASSGNAAGTEFMGTLQTVAPYSSADWYGLVRLDAADYLTGLASLAGALTIEGEGEIGVA